MTSALLHDIGHGPYSHSLEYIYKDLGFDHVTISKKIIFGYLDIIGKDRLDSKTIPEIIEKNGMDVKEVANLIDSYPKKKYLGQLIHGSIDADRIDYLLRDAHYTGAVHGVIDLPRLLEIVKIHDNEIVIDRKGISTIEEMLFGRVLMYNAVYFHKTVVIAEEMLGRAVESCRKEAKDFLHMGDSDLMEFLLSKKGITGKLARKLKYRKLFKKAYISFEAIESYDIKSRKELERDICRKAKLSEGSVIVNIPKHSEEDNNIKIFDNGEKPIKDYSGIIEFLKTKRIPEWSILVAADERNVNAVKKRVKDLL